MANITYRVGRRDLAPSRVHGTSAGKVFAYLYGRESKPISLILDYVQAFSASLFLNMTRWILYQNACIHAMLKTRQTGRVFLRARR